MDSTKLVKKNQVHQTWNFKLENFKNQVQIDNGNVLLPFQLLDLFPRGLQKPTKSPVRANLVVQWSYQWKIGQAMTMTMAIQICGLGQKWMGSTVMVILFQKLLFFHQLTQNIHTHNRISANSFHPWIVCAEKKSVYLVKNWRLRQLKIDLKWKSLINDLSQILICSKVMTQNANISISVFRILCKNTHLRFLCFCVCVITFVSTN